MGVSADRVLGLAAAYAPNLGRISDREANDTHAETLRHREVTGLMYDD